MRIKRKVSISCLGGRLGICLLLAFVPQLLFAQEDSVRFIRDSIQIQPEFNESLFSPFELPSENSAPSIIKDGVTQNLIQDSTYIQT
jgi:hypothetical protein